jgi:hypothetical protein
VLLVARARAAGQPDLAWYTIETPHFRITFDSGERSVAMHVADLCEDIYGRLSPAVGWEPSQRTEILLTDQTDAANGSAVVLPYNAIRLNVTAPDDLSPLGDVDDWYLELVTHEYTHVLHIDHTRGLPALANLVVGKQFAPNQIAPRWLLEGLAVYEESSKTSGGRLRSSMWNMWMRADVLEGNIAPLDVMSNSDSIRRWPQGNLKYLYGSYFMSWIAETYGEQAIRAFIDDYGWQIIPFAVNRSLRRATGRTFEEMYPAWVDTLKREFDLQAEAIRSRGVREGVRLTHTGQQPEHPRWIPANAWPGAGGDAVVYLDDGNTRSGLQRLPLVRDANGYVVGAREKDRELMVRGNGTTGAAFAPDGTLYFSASDQTNNLYFFDDLFSLPAGEKSVWGLEGRRSRLTYGFRAIDPDISPDGRHVVFTTNHRGTTYLQMADVHDGSIDHVRALVPSNEFEQAFTPRWSPDGSQVAYSAWRAGGYRDIRLVDVQTGAYREITHDRAVDGDPSFSKDGRWLLFHSDRTGVTNVYAYELATGHLFQVTNVVNGAFQPELSPDGKNLLYLGYTHQGYDVFAMPFDPARFLEALPYEDDRPSPPAPPQHREWKVDAYNPIYTLIPRAYTASLTQGNFGELATISAGAGDIVGHHGFSLTLADELKHPALQGSLAYTYARLPVDLNFSVSRSISPAGGLSFGPSQQPTWIREQITGSSGVSYSLPRAFDSMSFSMNYNFARVGGNLNVPLSAINPYVTPSFPSRGEVGYLSAGFSYSNAEGYLWSVGNEHGFSLTGGLQVADPWLGGQYSGYSSSLGLSTYFLMPWLKHHALAMHMSVGASGGGYPGLGAFYVGGYVDESAIQSVEHSIVQSSLVLRGYAPVTEVGRYYTLFNTEYRFPILELERGVSTYPAFLSRISGAAYFDYGSAYNDPEKTDFRAGSGGELWFDTTFSYVIGLTFRLGFEHGWSAQGIDKAYFIAVAAF